MSCQRRQGSGIDDQVWVILGWGGRKLRTGLGRACPFSGRVKEGRCAPLRASELVRYYSNCGCWADIADLYRDIV